MTAIYLDILASSVTGANRGCANRGQRRARRLICKDVYPSMWQVLIIAVVVCSAECLAGSPGRAYAQDARNLRNAVYFEGAGSSIGFTVNYERTMPLDETGGTTLRLRVGGGYIPWEIEYSEEPVEFTFPATASLSYLGLEVGVGITLSSLDKNAVMPGGIVAFRHTFREHLWLRLSASPIYWQGEISSEGCGHYDACYSRRNFFVFPGLSVGYRF